jgi:uncharacterized protein
MKTIAVRLVDGEDILASVKRIAGEHSIEAGVVLSGVGSLKTSNIRVPVINGKVTYINPTDLEIDALHGTVSKNGCHIHITVSDCEGRAWGGHVKEGCIVRTTCELVIGILEDRVFMRSADRSTGFDELEITI